MGFNFFLTQITVSFTDNAETCKLSEIVTMVSWRSSYQFASVIWQKQILFLRVRHIISFSTLFSNNIEQMSACKQLRLQQIQIEKRLLPYFAIFGSGIEKEIIISPSLHPRLAKNWMHVLRTYILSCFKAHLSSWHYSARIRLKLTVIAWTFHNKLKASHIKSQIIVWLAFHFIEVLHNRQRKEPRHLVIQSATSRWS